MAEQQYEILKLSYQQLPVNYHSIFNLYTQFFWKSCLHLSIQIDFQNGMQFIFSVVFQTSRSNFGTFRLMYFLISYGINVQFFFESTYQTFFMSEFYTQKNVGRIIFQYIDYKNEQNSDNFLTDKSKECKVYFSSIYFLFCVHYARLNCISFRSLN